MEQWEAIRRLARAKRNEIRLIAGSDSGVALLKAAEQRTGLQCRSVRSGDPLLCGAEAVLDPEAQTIWYNSDLDVGITILHRAHEFAHFWIDGAHSACTATDLDPETSEDRTPIGVERVESYGPKERRELQANVFAREFLLPAISIRSWFIQEKLDAAAIAERVGVPEGIAFHQLLYALLTPKVEKSISEDISPSDSNGLGLDPSQEKAAHAPHGPLLVEAGPGTGKTRTLVGRVTHLIQDQKVDPASILVLTFSNKAAEEMRERVARVLPAEAPHIWMGTFHSFGLELLRKFGTHIGLPPKPEVIDPVAALFLLERSLPWLQLQHYLNLYEPTLALRDILQAISRAKDELVGPAQYVALAQQMRENAASEAEIEAAEKALEVANVYTFYQSRLDNEHQLDFGDLIFKSVTLLEQSPNARDDIRRTYRHVLVDEYQDVNRACALLLKQLVGTAEGLWVVGDVRQSIYRFRGAAPQNMQLFERDFPGAKILSLARNYRSQPKILTVFGSLAPRMRATKGAPFTVWENYRSDEGGRVLMEVADDLKAEGKGIAREIRLQLAKGIPYREQAVLCRSHTSLVRLANILEQEGIPILYLGDLFERPEIRDLLALISLASGVALGLLRVSKFPEYDIPLEDVKALLQFADERQIPFPQALIVPPEADTVSNRGKVSFALLAQHLQGLSYGTSPWILLTNYLFVRSRYLQTLLVDTSDYGQQKRMAIYQFLRFTYEQSQSLQSGENQKREFLEYIRRLEIFGEEKQLRQVPEAAKDLDAVRLLTIHASKGLEFRTVYLPVLGQGYFPARRQAQSCPPPIGMIARSVDDDHEEEEECLFFVALSRAKDFLCLSRARRYGARNSNPSNLLSHISPILPRPPDGTVTWSDDRPDELALPSGIQPPKVLPELDVEALDLYLVCPLRYHYEYILGLRGKGEDTAYLQFHRCLYDVMRWAETELAIDSSIGESAILSRLDTIWPVQGPVDHPLELTYRKNAETLLISAFQNHLLSRRLAKRERLKVQLRYGYVGFTPDSVEILEDGTQVMRRMRTGRISRSEKEKNIYGLYHAAAQSIGGRSQVEIFSLSDGRTESVQLSEKMAATRLARYDEAIQGILEKQFSPQPSDRECPRCPNYFICTSTDGS